MDFNKFMAEEKPVNRWLILRVALVGAMCGALLAILIAIKALKW